MNDENLIPMNKRTKDEQREIQSKGGVASGKARRKKKTLKEIAEVIGNTIDTKNTNKIKKNFPDVKDEDITYNFELIVTAYNKALKGDVKAIQYVTDILGENPKFVKIEDDNDVVMKFIEGMIDD